MFLGGAGGGGGKRGGGGAGSGGRGVGGAADGAAARERLLEEARREREARERERAQRGPAVTVQRFLRGAAVRRRTRRAVCEQVAAKLADLATLAAMLAAKGVPVFLPPAAALQPLLARTLLLHRLVRLQADAAGVGLLARLAPWLTAALSARAAAAQQLAACPGAPAQLIKLVGIACEVACQRATSAGTRCVLLDLVLAACGGGAAAPPTDAPSPTATATAGVRVYARRRLRFIERVSRCLCFLTPVEGGAEVAGRVIEICLHLATCSAAAGPAGAVERAAGPTADLVACLLTLPWLVSRAAGSRGHRLLAAPGMLDALLQRHEEAPEALMGAGEGRPPPQPPARRRKPAAAAATPSPLAATSTVGSSGFAPPTKSFFDSPLARSGGGGGAQADAGSGSSEEKAAKAWPASAYLLGNLLQLLADTPPAGGGGGGGSDGSSGGAGAGVAPPLVGPLLAHLDPPAAVRALTKVADLMDTLPADTWGVSSPVMWAKGGEGGGGGGGGESAHGVLSPQVMPPPLVAQLRRLSSEAMAKAAARLLFCRDDLLKTARLRLPAEEDPEAGTYDAYAIDPRLAAWTGKEGSGSHLDAAASTTTSLMRSVWGTSKLALSFFKRLGRGDGSGGGGGGEGGGAPAPVALPPAPAPRALAASAASATTPFDDGVVYAFTRLYATLVAPRARAGAGSSSGGEGGSPIVDRVYLLNALAFTPDLGLIRTLWFFLVDRADLPTLVRTAAFKSTATPSGGLGALALLASLLGHWALVADDAELYARHTPLPLRELRHALRLLRDVLAHAEGVGVDAYAFPRARDLLAAPPTPFWPRLAAAAVGPLRSLYDRHSQRPLGPADMWVVDVAKVQLCLVPAHAHPPPPPAPSGGGSEVEEASRRLLAVLPFAVPFSTRAAMYENVREADRRAHQEGEAQVRITVARSRLFESAYGALAKVRGDALKRKVYVTFLNAEGMEEAGIDAGGLFKELWTSLASLVFDPEYGLFRCTPAGELYPNPASQLCSGLEDGAAFEFLGRVLGKALYEGVTIGPQFARFFLHRLTGRPVLLEHLPSLDAELYKSLMFVKTYEGDVEDLALTFTTGVDGEAAGGGGGGGGEVELIPGGAGIAVTAANRLRYIYLVAHARLNTSIERQTAAFLRGLREVIPPDWLAPFSAPELQVIISGSAGGVDVEDLRAHAAYVGGYSAGDRVMRDFWAVVAALGERDRAALLKFTTSCERAPPLGFRQLHPPFTLQRVPARDDAPLPSSSTCFHILKLPAYSSAKVMRAKLLQAIHSGAGFEMT
jgi:ubiquitin-protein ligase E3 C